MTAGCRAGQEAGQLQQGASSRARGGHEVQLFVDIIRLSRAIPRSPSAKKDGPSECHEPW